MISIINSLRTRTHHIAFKTPPKKAPTSTLSHQTSSSAHVSLSDSGLALQKLTARLVVGDALKKHIQTQTHDIFNQDLNTQKRHNAQERINFLHKQLKTLRQTLADMGDMIAQNPRAAKLLRQHIRDIAAQLKNALQDLKNTNPNASTPLPVDPNVDANMNVPSEFAAPPVAENHETTEQNPHAADNTKHAENTEHTENTETSDNLQVSSDKIAQNNNDAPRSPNIAPYPPQHTLPSLTHHKEATNAQETVELLRQVVRMLKILSANAHVDRKDRQTDHNLQADLTEIDDLLHAEPSTSSLTPSQISEVILNASSASR